MNLTELKILKLMAEGMTNQEIAETMYISASEVAFHIRRIGFELNKLSSDQQAAQFIAAIRDGLTSRRNAAA